MSSISVNGKGRPKATIQATQGEPSVPPPMISQRVTAPYRGRHHWLGEKPLYQITATKSHAGNRFGQNPYVDASLL